MSSYSLQHLDSEKYFNEFNENILYSFDNYIYKEHFRIGDGIRDEKELKHNLIMRRILCEDNCCIVNYIQDVIEDKVKIQKRNTKKRRRFYETFRDFCSHNNCAEDDFAKLAWSEKLW